VVTKLKYNAGFESTEATNLPKHSDQSIYQSIREF